MMYKIITNPPYLHRFFIQIVEMATKFSKNVVSLNPEIDSSNFIIKEIDKIDYEESLKIFNYRNPLNLCIYSIEGTSWQLNNKELSDIDEKILSNINKFPKFSKFIRKEVPLKDYCIVYSYIGGLSKSQDFVYHDNVSMLNNKTYKENVKNQFKKEYPKTHFSFDTFSKADEFRKYINSKLFKYIEYLTQSGRFVCLGKLPYIEFEKFDEIEFGKILGLTEAEVNLIQEKDISSLVKR